MAASAEPAADLAVAKTGEPDEPRPGQAVTYVLEVASDGPRGGDRRRRRRPDADRPDRALRRCRPGLVRRERCDAPWARSSPVSSCG